MSSIGEIEESINSIFKMGNNKVALMHCVSDYPAKYEETNLNVIKNLKRVFKVPVGFSDHTEGMVIPVAAVCCGADLIEKHFTIDKNLPGPDHKLSLNPAEFSMMVEGIRSVEKSFGDGVKRLTPNEIINKKLARRSLTAKIDIKMGETIKKEKIKIVRPADGIEPKFINIISGKTAKIDIKEGQPITWDCI